MIEHQRFSCDFFRKIYFQLLISYVIVLMDMVQFFLGLTTGPRNHFEFVSVIALISSSRGLMHSFFFFLDRLSLFVFDNTRQIFI